MIEELAETWGASAEPFRPDRTVPSGGPLTSARSSQTGEVPEPRPAWGAAEAIDRDAVIRSLYDERDGLSDRESEGTLSASERSYLEDVEREINRLEREEREAAGPDVVWTKLQEIAKRVLALHESG